MSIYIDRVLKVFLFFLMNKNAKTDIINNTMAVFISIHLLFFSLAHNVRIKTITFISIIRPTIRFGFQSKVKTLDY